MIDQSVIEENITTYYWLSYRDDNCDGTLIPLLQRVLVAAVRSLRRVTLLSAGAELACPGCRRDSCRRCTLT